jgi:hypothetical protein
MLAPDGLIVGCDFLNLFSRQIDSQKQMDEGLSLFFNVLIIYFRIQTPGQPLQLESRGSIE